VLDNRGLIWFKVYREHYGGFLRTKSLRYEKTKVAHNSEDKVVDLLRDSTIYVSIYLRVQLVIYGKLEEPVMLYLRIMKETLKAPFW